MTKAYIPPRSLFGSAPKRVWRERMEGIVRRRLGLGMVAALAVLLAACGGGSDSSTSSTTPAADTAPAASTAAAAAATTASTEPVTLTIDTFGDFGYKQLIADYVKLHPNVTVKEIQQEYNQHHQQLAQHLAAGSGAAGHRRDRRGLHRPVPQHARQVREPARPRRRRPQGPLAALEVGGVDVGRRQDADRPRHRRRRPRHVLSQGPVRGRRPAQRPRGAVRDVARLARRSSPRARSSRRPAPA